MTSFAEITAFSIAPARITSFSFALANSLSTLAVATASGRDAVHQRSLHVLGQPGERRAFDGAARKGVLENAQVHARFAAFARNSVMRPTSRPRYSATTIDLAFASCAETSATTAFFLSRSRPKVYLHCQSRESRGPAAPTATLHSA